MSRLDSMTLLKLRNQSVIAPEKSSYFSLTHGFSFLFKPGLVSKFRVFLRDMTINRHRLSYAMLIKVCADSGVRTSGFTRNLFCGFPQVNLLFKPCGVVHLREVGGGRSLVVADMVLVKRHDKVLDSVVKRISVYVMHLLEWLKVSAEMLLHYKTVLINVSRFLGERMIRHLNAFVSVDSCMTISPPPMTLTEQRSDRKTAFLLHVAPPLKYGVF